MLSQTIAASAVFFGLAAGYAIPTEDGFPDPSARQLHDIQRQAGGLLPNDPAPQSLSRAGIADLQLVAFNENVEIAFFSSLIDNITNQVADYEFVSERATKAEILDILKTSKAQEELHALSAIKTLESFGASLVPEPCIYQFPSNSLSDAISLAETLTAVLIGTLQNGEQSFVRNGDNELVRTISSVIGQEGEQSGFLRFLLNRKPSEKPFLTANTGALAFSYLQQFIVECPFDVKEIPIPIFPALNVETKPKARDMKLTFSADLSSNSRYREGSELGELFVTYLAGQQLPISVPISNARWNGQVLTFEANFPFTANVMEGLSIATLTAKRGFPDVDSVVQHTVAAPGLIQVNKMIAA